MKMLILIVIVFLSVDALAAKTPKTSKNKSETTIQIPVRYFYKSGNPIPPQDIWVIHSKDCIPCGWRWSNGEWLDLLNGLPHYSLPAYYVDPEHGSNHGWLIS